MSEIENKFSDFQKSECVDLNVEGNPIDQNICPTCFIDPSFVPPIWWEEKNAFLDKRFCEYQVRVYSSEIKDNYETRYELREKVIDLGITKILVDFQKPLNNPTRAIVKPATYIKDEYLNLESKMLGTAFLVTMPAFNLDKIPSEDEEDQSDNDGSGKSPKKIIIDVGGLNRKLRQLSVALRTYRFYYASSRAIDEDFVLREESNIVNKINYKKTIKKLNQFKKELNSLLSRNRIARIDETGFLKPERAERIKITFKDSGGAYNFKEIFVHTNKGCKEYKRLKVSRDSVLRSPQMAVIYNFLNNLDKVINDITARETKPWLDFTLEHFYPKYILDKGNIADVEEQAAAIGCLLEYDLGFDQGKIIDSVTKEIISAFNVMGSEFAKQACGSIEQFSSKGPIQATKDKNLENTLSAKESRQETMINRYKKEYKNKFYSYAMKELPKKYENKIKLDFNMDLILVNEEFFLKRVDEELQKLGTINEENIFEKWRENLQTDYIEFFRPTYSTKEIKDINKSISDIIYDHDDLDNKANAFANQKFKNLENSSFYNRIENSPFYAEFLEASEELFKDLKKTYVDGAKKSLNGESDIDIVDYITSIGLCGTSKMAGTALECLLGGIKFEDFMEVVVEKFFSFMEVNTLDLFFNGLPSDIRESIDKGIKEEFGGDVSLTDIFNILKASPPSGDFPGPTTTLDQITKTKVKTKELLNLFEKYQDPAVQGYAEERKALSTEIDSGAPYYRAIIADMSICYNRETKSYNDIQLQFEDKYKPAKKYMIARIKSHQKSNRKNDPDFKSAKERFSSAMNYAKTIPAQVANTATNAANAIKDTISESYNDTKDFLQEKQELVRLLSDKNAKKDEILLNSNNIQSLQNEILSLEDQLTKSIELQSDSDPTISDLSSNLIPSLQSNIASKTLQLNELKTKGETLASELEQIDVWINNRTLIDDVGRAVGSAIDKTQDFLADSVVVYDETKMNIYEEAALNFSETALGAKVDAVFDLVLDSVIDRIFDYFKIEELFSMISDYPMADIIIDKTKDFFTNQCPVDPIFHPAPGDFMKSFSLDVCTLDGDISIPKMFLPSVNWKFILEQEFSETFTEAIIKLVTDLLMSLMKRILDTIEGALCKSIQAAGGLVAGAIKDGSLNQLGNRLVDALDEAFCNGSTDDDSRKRAEDLVDSLFSPLTFDPDSDYENFSNKVSNVISSVSSKSEILEAIVSPESESNRQFEQRVSNAVLVLVPEASSLFGDPDSVGDFFRNLGSYIPVDQKNKIRDMLDQEIDERPVSDAICLTDDQLRSWNELRKSLISPTDSERTPKEIVDDLNKKTMDVLESIIDDISRLGSEDGPFLGALSNEILKDACDPNNILNDKSEPEFEKEIENDAMDASYNNLTKLLMIGFLSRGGLLAESMRDKEGRSEFFRPFYKFFNPNYGNSQEELNIKYDNKRTLGQFIMKLNSLSGSLIEGRPPVQGDYPDTIGIKQRKELLETDTGREYKLGDSNITIYKYGDESDEFSYNLSVRANNAIRARMVDEEPSLSFDYRLRVVEETFEDKAFIPSFLESDEEPNILFSSKIKVGLTENQKNKLESIGLSSSSTRDNNLRKSYFDSLLRNKVGLDVDFRELYDLTYTYFNKAITEELLTDRDSKDSDDLPIGYKFGYSSDNLEKSHFTYYNPDGVTKYNIPETEGVLGKFGNDRIVALDPKIYGGRYSNPPFYVEPPQQFGWMEIATKAFESGEGCDPKKQPIFNFSDIKNREKYLKDRIKNDPRLTKDRRCVSVKPFKILQDSKTKSALEATVRMTIRTYIGEYFIKGYGLFSNLQIRKENFDSGLYQYILEKMKKEMSDLGTFTSSSKIRIVRERYWYTFLEQCVEIYQRMLYDLKEVEASDEIKNSLNKIQMGLDKFSPINKNMKKQMRESIILNNGVIPKPNKNFDKIELLKNQVLFNLQSVIFRLSSEEEREDFFNGENYTDLTASDIFFASIKKLQFFQKIYFIKIFEEEASMIAAELIKDELNRLNDIVVDGISDKPKYYDLSKSIFGMQNIFPGSNSQIGLNTFYTKKQAGVAEIGTVPDVNTNRSQAAIKTDDQPRFVVEKYLRLSEPNISRGTNLFSEVEDNLKGVVSFEDFSNFIDSNEQRIGDSLFSDHFGDLSLVFPKTMKTVFEQGFVDRDSVKKLMLINPEMEDQIFLGIRAFYSNSNNPKDQTLLSSTINVTEEFIVEGENIQPSGTTGSLGVKYGLRISIVLPQNYLSTQDLNAIRNSIDLNRKGNLEKTFLTQDGFFSVPLVESEVELLDSKIVDFDPYGTQNPYDLECLINKMVGSDDFILLFENCLNLKQISTMVGVYCIETLPPAIGRDESERYELEEDPDVDQWDRTTNKFAKNFLRKKFKSNYLANTADGEDDDDDSDFSLMKLFQFSNPFDFELSIKLPWWKLRRQKFKIYDKNTIECADPKKDLI